MFYNIQWHNRYRRNYSPRFRMVSISFILFVICAVTENHFTFLAPVEAGHIEGIKVFLSTKSVKDVPANISAKTLFGDLFDPQRNTKILIHGFIDTYQYGEFIPSVRDAYLRTQDVNVIGVDWSWWIGEDYFKIVSVYLRVVAKRITSFIKMLVEHYKADLSKIHLIGHSLGAHTSGMVGLLVRKYFKGKKLGRITGLDPAGEGFVGRDLKLTKDCADFVDVLHSDDYGLGLPEMNSHVDFYINGGNSQPACGSMPGACSHNLAHHYWVQVTLNRTAFLAVKCDSWLSFTLDFCCCHEKTYLGEDTSKTARGAFYLVTSKKSPYGIGKDGLRVKRNSSYLHYITYGLAGCST